MNILYMGTPKIAVPSLQSIIENNFLLVGVVSQPDKPKGRGNQFSSSPIKQFALSHNLQVFTPVSLRKDLPFIETVKTKLSPDLIVVVAYGQILPPALLEIPKFGCINLHFSLLPKYRGAAPVAWALMNGESQTGVSTMFLNEKMDEGDIIFQESIDIHNFDNRATIESNLSTIGASLLIKNIQAIKDNNAPRIPQNHQDASYAPRLKTSDGLLDWNKSATQLFNQIRGLFPDPGAFTHFNGKRIKIIESSVVIQLTSAKPGTIISIQKGQTQGILVATGKDILLLKIVQPEGKKPIPALDFANGYHIQSNQEFSS